MKKFILCTVFALIVVLSAACGTESPPVYVGVIDSGISSEVIGKDRVLSGKNYLTEEFDAGDTEDRVGHGTAVSAFISGSEAAGVEGVCPDVKLVPLVYTSVDSDKNVIGGTPELAAEAVLDAVDRFGCRIICIASGTKQDNEKLRDAVKYAEDNGVLVVSCAGNSESDEPGMVFYPGGYESVLCVGSSDEDGERASFSQNNEAVDILVQGTDLRLVTIKGTKIRGSGTSYSAAKAAGAAARILQRYGGLDSEELKTALVDCSDIVLGMPVLDTGRLDTWEPDNSVIFITVMCIAGVAVLATVVFIAVKKIKSNKGSKVTQQKPQEEETTLREKGNRQTQQTVETGVQRKGNRQTQQTVGTGLREKGNKSATADRGRKTKATKKK